MGLLRTIVTLAVLAGLAYLSLTVELGDKTLVQHVRAIWATEETRELVDGVKETSEPVVERVKRGLQAGVDEARREEGLDAGSEGAGEPAPASR